MYWEKDFALDNLTLRIRGINSALISNENDDIYSSKLLLSSHQSLLKRDEGVINIVLCHHPPDWLYDGDGVSIDLKARARLHLFGHKHEFSSELINGDCLVLAAGAMQPSRRESQWEPRYNILEIGVLESPNLNIKLFKRSWDKSRRKFKADFTDDGKIFNEYKLKLTDFEIKKTTNNNPVFDKSDMLLMDESVIDVNSPDPKRKLAYMFLGLPYHIKVQIAVEFDLIEDSDRNLDEVQRAQIYFRRASEKKLHYELWEAIMKNLESSISNPFNK